MFSAKFRCFNLKQISYVGSCFFKCFNPLKCWTSTSWDRKFSFGNTESFACLDLFGRAARGAYAGIWFEQTILVSGLGGWRFASHFYMVTFHGTFDKDHQHKVGLFVDLCQGPTFQERGFGAQPIFAIFTPQHGKRFQYSDSAYKDWSNQRDVNFDVDLSTRWKVTDSTTRWTSLRWYIRSKREATRQYWRCTGTFHVWTTRWCSYNELKCLIIP